MNKQSPILNVRRVEVQYANETLYLTFEFFIVSFTTVMMRRAKLIRIDLVLTL